ncbi:hypothetical protein JQS43_05260 [Natronosporangium hydrolyticum]|uniref:Uncharacterized protein n=1 Tax=Natronosporangium hydrolyticum TaxID=2811111 RepID=A0A895YNP7_9ACTN|nr:hypothetical protein [Natronosporangium hydrolyticum]QSB15750.1 hypothetical protein JQS43_05260 [Natronosporangium hydrolyticum]
MVNGLATSIIVAGLLVGGFAVVTAMLDRPPGLLHLAGLAVLEGLLVVQAIAALTNVFAGERPADGLATFIGYLLTAVLIPPLAALLSMAERTRWGSVIVAIAAGVTAVLVLRLQQVWSG